MSQTDQYNTENSTRVQVSLSVPLPDLENQTETDPTSQLPLWYPGRYRASVREECGRWCVCIRCNGQVCHTHFDFTFNDPADRLEKALQAEAYLYDLLEEYPDTTTLDGITHNNWRYIDPAMARVEMRLDAIGPKDRSPRVTTFDAIDLETVLAHSWGVEMHNGAARAVCIPEEVISREEIHRISDVSLNLASPSGRMRGRPLYLHELLSPVPEQSSTGQTAVVAHRNGDMLDNTRVNLVIEWPEPHPHQPMNDLLSSETDSILSTPPKQHHHQQQNQSKRRTNKTLRRATIKSERLRINNKTGIPGLSQTKDATRLYVKLQRAAPHSTIRRSFSVPQEIRVAAKNVNLSNAPQAVRDRITSAQFALRDRAIDFISKNMDEPDDIVAAIQPSRSISS